LEIRHERRAAGDGASRADGLTAGAILERVGRPLQCGILAGLRTGMGHQQSSRAFEPLSALPLRADLDVPLGSEPSLRELKPIDAPVPQVRPETFRSGRRNPTKGGCAGPKPQWSATV